MNNQSSPQTSALPGGRSSTKKRPLQTLFGEPIRLAAGISALSHEDTTLLPSEDRCLEIEGPLIQALLPMLDGQNTAADLVRQLRDRFSPPQVLELLGMLANEGVLVADGPAHASQAEQKEVLEGKAIALDISGAGEELLRQALAEHSIEVLPAEQETSLKVRLVDDYFGLTEDASNAQEQSWLPVKLAGDTAWFGPIFRPEQGACPSCLDHRLKRTQEAHILANSDNTPRLPGKAARAAAQICAMQIMRWLEDPEGDDHPLIDALATFDGQEPRIELHKLVQRPQCPTCGSADAMEPVPIHFGAGENTADDNKGKRSDEAVLDRYSHHVDPLTGLITALDPVSEHPVNVYRARYVRPLPADTSRRAVENRRLVAAGKGTTTTTAHAGALAEALERYSSTWDGSEAMTTASANQLGESCILPNDCMLFSEDQLRCGSLGEGMKYVVPNTLDPDASLGWLKAWSLSHNEWRHVAAGWALMGYRGPGQEYAVGDSNGNAAGWSIEDAIMRGVGELVERDAVALWWYNRVRRPGVCLDGVKPDYITQLREHYLKIGREFWVLDLTSDIGLPTFAAVSQCTGGDPATPAIAFGTHIDAETAVLRAITEMNQMLPHALARAPREDRPAPQSGRGDSMGLETLDGHTYIKPDTTVAETRLDAFSTPAQSRLVDQITWVERKLAAAGLETLVLDHTRPDVKLPVVRVIVPGLRHFWRRLAPGRLYDVPVQLGWCEEPITQTSANSLELAI